jgi:hypothetical protein
MIDFLRTGAFGPLTLGASREHVRRAFGEPETASSGIRLPAVFRYGDFEFHFAPRTDVLHRIRSERFGRFHAGDQVELDPWWMGTEATLEQAQGELANVGISLEPLVWPYTDNTIRFRAGAGVTLIFQQQAPQKFLGLVYAA